MAPDSSAKVRSADDTWREIEEVIHDVAALAKTDVARRDFYEELLTRGVRALAAVGGAVWFRGADGQLRLESQVQFAVAELEHAGARQQHLRLVELILQSGEARAVSPHSALTEQGEIANPTACLLLLCPVVLDAVPVLVLEILQRTGTSQAAQQGYLRFLSALGELAADYHRNLELRQVRERAALWGKFEQYAERLHGSLDLNSICYEIANEGRRLVDCDRLSVAILHKRQPQLTAVSGVDVIDRRAATVRGLEQLVGAVLAAEEPLWYTEEPQELPPQIESLLQAYVDGAHARLLAIIPLKSAAVPGAIPADGRPKMLGAVIVEQFETNRANSTLQERVAAVRRHGELALRNALEYRSLPLYPVEQLLLQAGWFTHLRNWPRIVGVGLAVTGLIAFLALVPADFEIEGRGELQPSLRRDVFARSDGVVREILAQHAVPVKKDDVLVRLRKPELDFEFSRVVGEIQTSRKRLATLQAARLGANVTDTASSERYHQLTGEEEELKELLTSLQEQYQILQTQQADLDVRSPLDGQVLTWDVKQLLESRPVERGQVLMTVADLNAPWVLEIRVPERHIGYVLASQQTLRPNLEVSFRLATDPQVTYRGEIRDVAAVADINASGEATVLVTVGIPQHEISRLRPGATVIPRIDCGRRSLGFVWLHDLWNAIQTRILF